MSILCLLAFACGVLTGRAWASWAQRRIARGVPTAAASTVVTGPYTSRKPHSPIELTLRAFNDRNAARLLVASMAHYGKGVEP